MVTLPSIDSRAAVVEAIAVAYVRIMDQEQLAVVVLGSGNNGEGRGVSFI